MLAWFIVLTSIVTSTSTLPKYENNYSEYLGNKIQETMYVWPTCPMEVKNILINSKPKLSAGFDEIPLKLLKSSDNIIMALSHIFNLSLSTGKVISDFKIAKIIPLYKKVCEQNMQTVEGSCKQIWCLQGSETFE